MKIAITGATGQLGRLVVSKLKEKVSADRIVALVRSVEKATNLGVEAREADYDHPQTLGPALKGVDTLLLISGSEVGKRTTQHKNVIEAAKQAGVKWIVYTSLLRADTSSLGLAGEHLATEAALKESGIPYTVLRNGWYNENYAGSIQGALAGGALIGSAGEGKIASATRADYAEAAVAVLTSEGHGGKTYELAGDEPYTLSDLAAEISRQTGKNIPYTNLSPSDYAASLTSMGVPEGFVQMLAGIDVSTSKGDLYDGSRQLSKLIGRPTTPLSVTVAQTLKGVA
jgi:NAD(P)H dehydrogenase (quinone)